MQQNLEQLKQSLDIINIAELYGELIKAGTNFKYKNDISIVINPSKQIFSNFNGDITGGSVLDLIMYMEKINLKDGITRLKELAGAETYHANPALQIKRKEEASKKKNIDFTKLALYANNDLTAGLKYLHYELEFDGHSSLSLNQTFHKLFECTTLPIEMKPKLDYIHKHIIGFDAFYQCPSIIIRDCTGKIIDKCAYRPKQPKGFDNWTAPKYIHKNTTNRGKDFLYPFQIEIEKIIKREKYFVIGEGIKNAVNALLYSIPFISIESTSNSISVELKEYILDLKNKGFAVTYMFDGDKAGKTAFENFKEHTGLVGENYFDFSSNIDFAEYMVGK